MSLPTPKHLLPFFFSALIAICVSAAPLLVLTMPADAFAQSKVEAKLDSAIEDYDVLQIQDAEKKLEEAIALADRNNVDSGLTLARVHIMLGIVRFAVNRDEAATEDIFVKAVEADPAVEIDAVYKTPTLSDIMARARKRAKPREKVNDKPPVAVDGLTHDTIKTAEGGKDLEVEAIVPADMPVYKVFLHFRRYDQQDFTRIEMEPTSTTRFAITIAGDEIRTSQIDYFILAEDRGGEIIDQIGTVDAPLNVVVLGSSDVKDSDKDTDKDKDKDKDTDPNTSRKWVYITVLGGTDLGFLPGGSPTANPEREVNPGFVPAFGHLLLDLGVTITDAAHLGLFFRYQFAPAQDFENISIPDNESSFPSTKEECLGLGLSGDCILGLKYKWFFKNSRPLRLYSSAGTGIGRVRNWLQLKQAANTPQCQGKETELDPEFGEVCFIRDTVRTGWLHFGVGGGLAYEVTDFMDINADLYLMLMVPDTSINLDASAGATFRF